MAVKECFLPVGVSGKLLNTVIANQTDGDAATSEGDNTPCL